MKKIEVLGLAVLLLVNSISFAAGGIIPGSGTSSDPYRIEDLDDMVAYANDVSYWASGVYTWLTTDLDFSSFGTIPRAPIAPNDFFNYDYGWVTYQGIFNGAGHTISNLNMALPENGGMFGIIGPEGSVRNLNVINSSITGGNYVGLFCGENQGQISYCNAQGSVSGDINVGGFVGLNAGVIYYCSSSGQVTGTMADEFTCVGGFVGQNYSGNDSDAYIYHCFSHSEVNAAGKAVGGFAGISWGGYINMSYSTGNVSAHSYLGGFIGTIQSSNNQQYIGVIQECYSTGNVTGNNRIGGFAGENGSSIIWECYSRGSASGAAIVGGFCGCLYLYPYDGMDIAYIDNCYSTGPVSGSSETGGLIGRILDNQPVANSFWDTDTSGWTSSAGGTGKTTSQMCDINLYINSSWDFAGETSIGTADIWRMPAASYPVFAWRQPIPNINNDSKVDITDFALFSQLWLSHEIDAFESVTADFDTSGDVDISDLVIFAQQWLYNFRLQGDITSLHWAFDETAGTIAYDSSNYQLNGTVRGTPVHAPGIENNCLVFNGIDNVVEVNNYSGVYGSNPRTVAAWIKAEHDLNNTNTNPNIIFSWGELAPSSLWALLLDGQTGQLSVSIYGTAIIGGPDLEDGSWHHVAAILPDDANNINRVMLYVDGIQIQTNSNRISEYLFTSYASNFSIGAILTPSQPPIFPFSGSIDEAYIFHFALDEDDLAALAHLF